MATGELTDTLALTDLTLFRFGVTAENMDTNAKTPARATFLSMCNFPLKRKVDGNVPAFGARFSNRRAI